MNTNPNMVIESLGVYLPPNSKSTTEILAGCKRKVLFPLEQITGIKSRRVAEGEFSIDLALKAVKDCLAHSSLNPEDIDLLICCNISRYDAPNTFSFEPTTAIRVSRELGFGSALTFDVSNACAGVFTGLYLAESFLRSGSTRNAMVVSGEYITHLAQTAQKEMNGFLDPQLASLTIGDSAIAMTLSLGESAEVGFQDLELYTLGKYSRYCVAQIANGPGGGAKMSTDSSRLSAVAIGEAAAHGVEMQRRGGWPPDIVDHFIMHQTSERTLKEGMERINRHYGRPICTPENTIFNLETRGNTATTSHLIAFYDHSKTGRIKAGDTVVFSVNASGLTMGGARYLCDDLPERLKTSARNKGVSSKVEPRIRFQDSCIVESIGIADRITVLQNETLPMAVSAAENCLKNSKYHRSQIDVLIYSGVYRTDHVCEPAIAAMLAGDLAMNDHRQADSSGRTLCFDVLAGAAGTLKSCCIATRLIQSGRAKRVMIVATEVASNTSLAIGPTGSAMILVQGQGTTGFWDFEFRDFPEAHLQSVVVCDLSVPGGEIKATQSPKLEASYVEKLQDLACAYLEKRAIDPKDIKLLLAPQISPTFLTELAKGLGLLHAMIDVTVPEQDLFTSSFPYALSAAKERGRAEKGDLALCLAAGSGIQVGCALYRF
jgi:3-oxoacyl-[acyl-carrier-protein] synthase III